MREIQLMPPKKIIIPRKKRVAAYGRVSSGKDAMLHSLAAQISYYNAYIQSQVGWQFAGVYADEGLTGTKQDRPEFQRLISDCRNGMIDMVITKSISRFGRNTVVVLETVRELKALGINVYFERENIHSMSGDGELLLTILASFAQEESRSASENQKWRIKKAFEDGTPRGGHMIGYRLVNGNFYIMPEEAAIVKMIFADYLDGMGVEAIRKKLNSLGILTWRGYQWSGTCVIRILRNEKYTGDMILQKTYTLDHLSKRKRLNRGELQKYHVTGCHDAIIDHDTFGRVQREIERRAEHFNMPKRPQKSGSKHLFTSKILCENCGKRYRRKINSAGTKYEKPVWICHTYNSQGKAACASQQIPESILLEKTREALEADDLATVFRERIAEIRVPGHNRLIFVFCDGKQVECEWANPSRRDSWTPEARSLASEKARAQHQIRKAVDL